MQVTCAHVVAIYLLVNYFTNFGPLAVANSNQNKIKKDEDLILIVIPARRLRSFGTLQGDGIVCHVEVGIDSVKLDPEVKAGVVQDNLLVLRKLSELRDEFGNCHVVCPPCSLQLLLYSSGNWLQYSTCNLINFFKLIYYFLWKLFH